ncbi:MAG: hypothetical protein MUF15_26360 [Acidobacteria bacterium]|jgi:hypothetical protein|nr:hypothetical protein [Acidobacteriota bacterium]
MGKSSKDLDLQADDPFSTRWKRGTQVVEKGFPRGGNGVPGWWKRDTHMVEMGYLGGGNGVVGQKYGVLGWFFSNFSCQVRLKK